RAALRQALHVLRGAFGAGMVVTRGDEEIALNVDHLWCDVVAFDAAITAGRFGEALELYRGDMLGGFFISGAAEFERWLETERARNEEPSEHVSAIQDRKSTRLNSSHVATSYAVFCLKKKKMKQRYP